MYIYIYMHNASIIDKLFVQHALHKGAEISSESTLKYVKNVMISDIILQNSGNVYNYDSDHEYQNLGVYTLILFPIIIFLAILFSSPNYSLK